MNMAALLRELLARVAARDAETLPDPDDLPIVIVPGMESGREIGEDTCQYFGKNAGLDEQHLEHICRRT